MVRILDENETTTEERRMPFAWHTQRNRRNKLSAKLHIPAAMTTGHSMHASMWVAVSLGRTDVVQY